jgi:DNA-binding XRE family transcriptional regulator
MTPKINIGHKIRAARMDRDITQKQLSDMLRRAGLGVYPANLCRIEHAKEDPTWTTVSTVAHLLEMDIAELVSYDSPNGNRRKTARKRKAPGFRRPRR